VLDTIGLSEAVRRVASDPFVGLDVETDLGGGALCLIQIGVSDATFLIDPQRVRNLSALTPVLGPAGPLKVIHNAPFEKRVLGGCGLVVDHVFDTLVWSRRTRRGAPGGHGLAAVCARELELQLDKTCQTSDWRVRPLSARQVDYAALDAEILVDLYTRIQSLPPAGL
jgi:ribonuclease D